MSVEDHKTQYLSMESFFMAHAEQLAPLIGERTAQYAWSIKDMSIKSPDTEASCRRVQLAIEKAVEGRSADWVLLVSESHDILSLEEWIEHSLERSLKVAKENETGYGDLDLNIETQLGCGMQLEAFHSGEWAKAKLIKLFDLESFEELEPISCKLSMPLPQVIGKLDQDLEFATKAGMRHPYKCSVGVGVICVRLAATSEYSEKLIPVVRRVRTSDMSTLIVRMRDELKERFKGLIAAVQDQQASLKVLPQGWPNQEVWQMMQDWSKRRFLGDNGLVGADLFEGDWITKELPHDVHCRMPEAVATSTLPPPVLDAGARIAKRRMAAETSGVLNRPSQRI